MNLISKLATSIAMASALAGSAKSADYVTESRFGLFGAGHNITVTHTEPTLVYQSERFCSRDICGNIYEGTRWSPRVAEKVTSQCTTSHVHWDESIIAAPGNLLNAMGNALTPRGTGPGVTRCYQAPAPHYGCGCR